MNILVQDVRSVMVLTGAGVSAESGVPTFRGEGGLWRHHRAEELATPRAFYRDPTLVWEWYDWRRGLINDCQPNPAHRTLAEMEAQFDDFVLVTQNVDGLHSLAGSQNLVELHGNIWRMRCTRMCRPSWEDRSAPLHAIPPRCPSCGEMTRPDVVWFGEALPREAIEEADATARRCQIMLVIGTSAVVQPAASLPVLALQSGAHLVEFNPRPTPLSAHVDVTVREPAAESVPRWWSDWLAES
ncbi:NAD-dependent deacylase [Chloroflexota bacterium]